MSGAWGDDSTLESFEEDATDDDQSETSVLSDSSLIEQLSHIRDVNSGVKSDTFDERLAASARAMALSSFSWNPSHYIRLWQGSCAFSEYLDGTSSDTHYSLGHVGRSRYCVLKRWVTVEEER